MAEREHSDNQDEQRVLRHDLRSPVSAVLGLSQMLLDELDGPLTDEQRHQVHLIHQAAETLVTIIDERLGKPSDTRTSP